MPIGFGCILTNLPLAGFTNAPAGVMPGGLFYYFYKVGLETEVFPILIFMGLGALTDFGPLIANPWTILMGAAAQFGVFIALLIALALGFNIQEAASIGIIGGADGPTAIYTTVKLAPHLLGPIAVACYSYMSLVPLIQPPIMRALTTNKERAVTDDPAAAGHQDREDPVPDRRGHPGEPHVPGGGTDHRHPDARQPVPGNRRRGKAEEHRGQRADQHRHDLSWPRPWAPP